MKFGTLATLPVAAAVALTFAAGPAWAQPTQSSQANAGATGDLAVKELRELDGGQAMQWNGMSIDQLEDMDIVNADGRTIGEIDEVLADAQGTVVAVTAEVGGFLGLGDKEVIVALDQLELQGDRFMTSLTSEQLEAMPRWDDD